MNERLSRLLDQFRSAEAAVDASQANLRRRSARRLEQLLKLSARERLESLQDPALTEFDRGQLEHSLQTELSARRPRLARTASSAGLVWRFVRYHRRACLRGAIALAPLAYFGSHAVMATPVGAVPVTIKTPLRVKWYMPGGYREQDDMAADADEIWVSVNGEGHLRRWIPRQGYAFSPVIPESFWTDKDIVPREKP